MHENRIAVVVTRKWQLAEGYHAVELQTKSKSELPPFDDGALINVVKDTGNIAGKTFPLVHPYSGRDAYVLGIRQEETIDAALPLNRGDEILIGSPITTSVRVEACARYVLFGGGIGIAAIAGVARRLASNGKRFELHSFAHTPERAVFKDELEALSALGKVDQHVGKSDAQIAQAALHAMSPTHANSQIYCSGPPAFMNLIQRHAREWVHAGNIHKIVLGHINA